MLPPGSPSPDARVPRRVRTRQATSRESWNHIVGGGGRGGWGGDDAGVTAVEEKKGGHGKGKRDLADAYMEVRDMLTDPSRLVRAVASGKAKGADPEWRRLEMFPVALKGGVKLQVVKYDERQAFTSNHVYAGADASASRGRRGRRAGADSSAPKSKGPTADEAADEALRCGFGNWRVETSDEVLQLRVTKSGEAMVSRSRSLLANASKGAGANVRSHDRQKQRLLDPSDPFLVHVGVSTKDGAAIKADRRDKYKQVEEFLRLVDAAVDGARQGGHMPVGTKERPTRLVDLGCGNAYLTFGAYALLKARRGQPLEVVGVDVKRQARETNGRVASALGWERDCVFVEGTIAGAELTFPTPRSHRGESSIVRTPRLTSCSRCTRATPRRTRPWSARYDGTRPSRSSRRVATTTCRCRLKDTRGTNGAHAPMLRHGILRERLGDLITDAFRAHVLRLLGHRVDVVEWIGGEHTPRNTMIRAVRTNSKAAPELWTEYDEMVATWGVTPWLAEALQPELAAAREEAMNDPVPLAADSEVVEKDSTD